MKYYLIIFSLFLSLLPMVFTQAQKAERKNIREGNDLYIGNKFTEAEIAYRKSLEVNPRSVEGTYNLGNALYKQEKFPEAAEQYQLMAGQTERLLKEDPKNAERMAQVFHNMGNIGMQAKEYQKSIEAYKQSLRLNPQDDETRYNLALAQKLLSDQENQDQNQDENKENKEDQEDQNKDQQENKQDEDDKKENKTQEEQQPDEQMSKDNAQQILDALLQDEKDTQEKVKKTQKQQNQQRKIEKQW